MPTFANDAERIAWEEAHPEEMAEINAAAGTADDAGSSNAGDTTGDASSDASDAGDASAAGSDDASTGSSDADSDASGADDASV